MLSIPKRHSRWPALTNVPLQPDVRFPEAGTQVVGTILTSTVMVRGMQPNLSSVLPALEEVDADGLLLHVSSEDPNQRYLSGFHSVDPFTTLFVPPDIHLLVRGLDRGLARSSSNADTVAGPEQYDFEQLADDYGRDLAGDHVVGAFCRDHGAEDILVPETFPVGMADTLRSIDISIHPDRTDIIAHTRATKQPAEIEHIRTVQSVTERAMAEAEEMLRRARIDGDGLLLDGEALTSERIREAIEISLLRAGCHGPETIVAGGTDAGDPHERGSGQLPARAPIVIDIFPRHHESGYHADMTRTFCVGEPDEPIGEWLELTSRAKAVGIEAIEPGATGELVHDAVCDVYEDAGIPTARSDPASETGFVHGTGHGVGLAVHEYPRLSSGGDTLRPGNVITVEPGVYDPDIGGCRIEDLLVVTEDGVENLTSYPAIPRIER